VSVIREGLLMHPCIIWRAWQDNTAYDPTKHRALQTLLNTTTEKAA